MYKENSYMGWSNIETWNTKLHMDNVYGLYKIVLRLYESSINEGDLADALEYYLNTVWGGFTPDKQSLKPVNWCEIANSIYEDYKEETLPV